MPLVQLSASFQSLSPATHKKIGPFWCCFPGGWFCVSSRTLWLFPTNSTVSLGVYPAASILTGVFNQRFEALFPQAGTLGCRVCLTSQFFLPVYQHENVGPPSPPATTLLRVLSARLPISASPTSLDECLFFNSLVV